MSVNLKMLSRLACLNEMGIDVYLRRDKMPSDDSVEADVDATKHETMSTSGHDNTSTGKSAAPNSSSPVLGGPDDEIWNQIKQDVSICTACNLHLSRTQTVFGVGNQRAEWMFVGEAPGFEEDRQGEPFVGRAGKLLDKMLGAMGFNREQVYIANMVKCRPPDNRNPRPEELIACSGYLQKQIKLVQPRIIIALGGVAAKALLQTEEAVGKLRGQVYQFGDSNIPLVVTYHPAYLLRSPNQKKAAWKDLQLAQRVVAGESSA